MIKKYLLLSVLLISIAHTEPTAEKKLTLDDDFASYVPQDIQKKCDGVDEICKKFYVGYYLYIQRKNIHTSLKYLVESYEQNASSVVDYMEARDYYLTQTIGEVYEDAKRYSKAIEFYQRSIDAGNKRAICYIGHIYLNQRKLHKAYKALKDGASQHFVECYTDLGRYYFNDEFGAKSKFLGGEYWRLAYKDDSYGVIENYNMGIYSAYLHDDIKEKFYTLKAAKMGDKDAQRYLESPLGKVSSTKLFLEEALGSHFWDVSKKKTQEFSNNYDLYYRFQKMFNANGEWIEDKTFEDAYFKKNTDVIVKFDRGLSSLIFDHKKLILKTQDKKDIPLLYEVMLVDVSGAKVIVNLYHELIKKLTLHKSFQYHRNFKLYGYAFIWYVNYDDKSHKLLVEIEEDGLKVFKLFSSPL